jgi:hypothetical protein
MISKTKITLCGGGEKNISYYNELVVDFISSDFRN